MLLAVAKGPGHSSALLVVESVVPETPDLNRTSDPVGVLETGFLSARAKWDALFSAIDFCLSRLALLLAVVLDDDDDVDDR